jgi:hypothetical protein
MKIRPVGAELFHADGSGQTDMARLIVAFRKLVNTPKTANILKMNVENLTVYALVLP